jgi:hypothetical protein
MRARDEIEDPRRLFLVRALASGLFMVGASAGVLRPVVAGLLGRVPKELPPGKSIYELKGEVFVNGAKATIDTMIGPNDTVETRKGSRIIFVVGKDAFILRQNSQLKLSGGNVVIEVLRLLSGALLSVFGKTDHRINTVTATIGIRGTGIYVESEPDRSYVCTCYGIAEIEAVEDPSSTEIIFSEHHDAPRYILAGEPEGRKIRPAPFKDHTDVELMLIEELVGRAPPFMFSGGRYRSPRRGY